MLDIPGYKIKTLIAKGGMARIYLAEHKTRNRDFAIKVFHPDYNDPRAEDGLRQECKILSSLRHINIISIYEHGQLEDGTVYLVMEHIEGGSLQLRMRKYIDELQALGILIELAYVLQFIHNRGIVHGDVKPANILFRRDNSIVLSDFGSSRYYTPPFQKNLRVTSSTSLESTFGHICELIVAKRNELSSPVGVKQQQHALSPVYSSPEQIRGEPLDAKTDIYSLGVVFLEMICGFNPFQGSSLEETLENHLKQDRPLLNHHYSSYQLLINKMLATDRNQRFSSMHNCIEFIDDLLSSIISTEGYRHDDPPRISVDKIDDLEKKIFG